MQTKKSKELESVLLELIKKTEEMENEIAGLLAMKSGKHEGE